MHKVFPEYTSQHKSLAWGRKPEKPEETPKPLGEHAKLHTHSAEVGINPPAPEV